MFLHYEIVFVAGTSFKMASTLYQKWLTIFCQKAQNFEYFLPYNFDDCVQISPAYGSNTYQIMDGETLAFQCQHK